MLFHTLSSQPFPSISSLPPSIIIATVFPRGEKKKMPARGVKSPTASVTSPDCQLRNDLHVQPPERWRCRHLQRALKLRPPPQILHWEAKPRASGARQGFPSGSATYRARCKSERLAAGWGHHSSFHLRPSGRRTGGERRWGRTKRKNKQSRRKS